MPVGKRALKPCGTRAAYDRHINRGETPCTACIVARKAYNNEHSHEPTGKTAYDKSRYARVRAKKVASAQAWYVRNRPEKQAYDRRRKEGDSGRNIRLKWMYGMTLIEFAQVFEAQGFKCACCASTSPRGKNWCVDHDHVTGQIRGVLCNPCNAGLGGLGDNVSGVSNGLLYLHRHYALPVETVDEHY